MRKTWLLITACLIGLAGFTQTGKISGTVQDNSKKSIIGASASLLKAVDSSVLKNALTDKDGKFTFSDIDHGKYLVAVTVSGFRKAVSGEITVKNESTRPWNSV